MIFATSILGNTIVLDENTAISLIEEIEEKIDEGEKPFRVTIVSPSAQHVILRIDQ